MKKLIVLLILAFVPSFVEAQQAEATLNSPVSRTAVAKFKVDALHFLRAPVMAEVSVVRQDASNNDIDAFIVHIDAGGVTGCPNTPSQAPTVVGLLSALVNAAPAETGTDVRKTNFRIIRYLTTTTGCIQGVTLVP